MEYAPAQNSPKHIVQDVVEFEESQAEDQLAALYRAAQDQGYQADDPKRAFPESISHDESQREEQQYIVQDLHPQSCIMMDDPLLIGPEQLQLIRMGRRAVPEHKGKIYNRHYLDPKAQQSRRLPQLIEERAVRPVHQQDIADNECGKEDHQTIILSDIHPQEMKCIGYKTNRHIS